MAEDYSQEKIYEAENDYPKIVVLGAGFAGVNFIRQLKDQPVQLILIDKNNFHQFQPLLYQVAISGLEPDSIVTPIRKLFQSCYNLVFRMGKVIEIDSQNNCVKTSIGIIDYDYLVIATGSATNFYGMKGIEKHSIGLKTIRNALNIRSLILQNLEANVISYNNKVTDHLTKFVVVGGGPAGVEMAGALAEFKKYLLRADYPEVDYESMQIQLIHSGDRVLPAMSKRASQYAKEMLEDLGVQLVLNSRVTDYDGKTITIQQQEGNTTLESSTMIWTAGVTANCPNGIDPNNLLGNNRIKVNGYNQVNGEENIFAIGDVAAMVSEEQPNGHAMVAQVAIQQGKLLAKNILKHIKDGEFAAPFEYNDKGSMATIGKRSAVADIKQVYLQGRIGWFLWSIVHLISIVGFKNKVTVGMNWIMKYFTYEKANQLIIRRYHSSVDKAQGGSE